MDELIRDLSQIQSYAAGLQGLLDTAQAAAPTASTGADGSGMISVHLGSDGLPKFFRVDQNWQRRITPENVGQAVLEAFQAAMGDRLANWSRTLEQQGWRDKADELRLGSTTESAHSTAGQVPAAFRHPEAASNPRPIDAVTEDMIKAFDKVDEIAAAKQRTGIGTGTDRSGKLTLTLSPSALVSCVADVKWVSALSATMLMNALGEGLAAARTDLARQGKQAPASPGLTGLFAEALALLNNPQQVMDS